MTTILTHLAAFALGVLVTMLAAVWLYRRAEQRAFRRFWG